MDPAHHDVGAFIIRVFVTVRKQRLRGREGGGLTPYVPNVMQPVTLKSCS